MMERQVGQMVRLIDELLDLSRIANGKIELQRERLDIATAMTDAIESSRPLIESSGHHLTVVFPPQPTYVHGDRTRLAQVFTNLLNNSARYTLRGGQIRLRIEQQGDQVVVSLKDNGIGIPPQRLPRIFDMFSATDPARENAQSGLGIGLSLVRAVVEMHGGKVEAHSAGCGTGSEFIVRLPAAQLPLRPVEPEPGEEDIESGACYRILVVDDNVDSALSLTLMLKMMGHETHMVHDGLSAIHAAASYLPDVILLDIGLPELSGYEVCRRIREEPWGKSMVIIAQTGWGQDEDRRKSKETGFSFHLVKPIDPIVLGKLLAGGLQAA
jgi:CheY-like chemotaxis protein